MSDQTGNEQKADLAQEILNKILTDADFRQQLLDNPTDTLAQAGYIEGDDVSGYFMKFSSSLLGSRPLAVSPTPPIPAGTTAINCGGGGGGGGGGATTAINCGGGGGGTGAIPKPKPPVYPNDPTNS